MAYDEGLADRVRGALLPRPDIEEEKMFGGLAFMVGGHMCCGVIGDDLMVRVGRDAYEDALAAKGARPMDFTGRPLRGMVYVGSEGHRTDDALASWVRRGTDFVASLPPR